MWPAPVSGTDGLPPATTLLKKSGNGPMQCICFEPFATRGPFARQLVDCMGHVHGFDELESKRDKFRVYGPAHLLHSLSEDLVEGQNLKSHYPVHHGR